MSVASFKSGRSGSSRSEVRPASSPNSSRAIPCSVCRRPDHHPTPLNPELHQASSSGAALIAPLRALGVSIGQSASPRMNVLYSDAGSERSRRSEGGENHSRGGPAADGPRVSNTRALEQDFASVRIAHCSWCLAECAHAQVSEGFLLFRAAYRCGGCARRTVRCDTCTSDVANNTPGAKENYGLAKGGDRQCARCLGIVYDWRAPQAVNASLHR